MGQKQETNPWARPSSLRGSEPTCISVEAANVIHLLMYAPSCRAMSQRASATASASCQCVDIVLQTMTGAAYY
jgi:hypothetical protein